MDGPLIDVASLARALAGPGAPVLLDVRWRLGGPPGIEMYAAGHLPGAVFTDLERDLSGRPGRGGRHPLPAAADFQAAMRRAGVSAGRPVVVYDEADATAAARGWWLLRYFGHPDVRVLDGGYRAWLAAGRPVERGGGAGQGGGAGPGGGVGRGGGAAPGGGAGREGGAGPGGDPGPGAGAEQGGGDFIARPGHLPLLDAAGAAWLARHGKLLDARAGERYRGETEPVDAVAGHIPGAVSAPTDANVGPDGRFLPAGELRARFAALGVPGDGGGMSGEGGGAPREIGGAPREVGGMPGEGGGMPGEGGVAVGSYCGSGVTAAHEVLALAIAGIPAALYVGSWSEWITDPGRPVATGPGPG